MFSDITEQVEAERVLKASEERLVSQSNALTELTARHVDSSGGFDERLRGILRASARTLKVERIGLWRMAEDCRSIECVSLHRLTPDVDESGAVLQRADAPAYFEALERDRVIAAHDAHTDPRTCEFLVPYLRPHVIGAMLDVPIRQDDRMIGVLCAEHVGGTRTWTVDEQNFAVSTANLIAVAMADDERRAALARLADSEARSRLIVDTAPDAFIGIDTNGQIVTWNTQAEAIFGWTCEEALGRDMADTLIPPAYRDAHLRGMAHFLDTGNAPVVNTRLELSALHRSGREFPIEITITSPMPFGRGYFFGAFLRDISARREQEAQLHAAKESAEAATRAKSEFLASMSHELRTPLNGVLGYTQLLQRDRSLNPTQREALEAIAKCGVHLLDLINDVLDLSRIEAGRVDIEGAPTDLAQLIIDLKYVVADAARRKGLLLTMTLAPDVPRRVVLDGRHLRQVLLNLLGNAVKFTAQGEVRLSIEATADDKLYFEVSDTGIGIEPEGLEKIFEAFTQTREGAAAGGTGLGLAISQHLITTMGDELRVESQIGHGSRFYFALPLVPAGDVTAGGPGQGRCLRRAAARCAAGAWRGPDGAGGGRQHGESPDPRAAAAERRRPGDHRRRRAGGAPPHPRASSGRHLHGHPHVRHQRARGHAPAEGGPADRRHPGDCRHRQRVRRVARGGQRTPAAPTTCRSRCGPSRCMRPCTRTSAWSSFPPVRPKRRADPDLSSTSLRLRLARAPQGGSGHRQRHRSRGAGAGAGGW